MIAFRANSFIVAAMAAIILFSVPVRATESKVSASVSVDKEEITVGDIITLTVTARYPAGVEVNIPPLGDRLGEFFIRDISTPAPRTEQNETVKEVRYIITTYLVGDMTVPPVEVGYSYKDETGEVVEKKIETKPLTIHVKRTAPEDAGDIRDIKAPVDLPFDWRPYLLWGGTALAAAALVVLGFLYFKKLRPSAQSPAKSAPPVPPHERALSDLDRIEAMGLIEIGRFDLYYDLVTDTLRIYLGARYRFNGIDMTTDEVIISLDRRLRKLDLKDSVVTMLRESDLVKFAKGESDADRAQKLIEETRRVVRETTRDFGTATTGEV